MIIIKKRLRNDDRIAVSSEHHRKIGTYLQTKRGTFVYVDRIIIYDKNKKEEICEFPFFKDLEDKVNEIRIGFESNAEAFICGSKKKITLQKRRVVNFDGEVFYVGKSRYLLYIPEDLFEILSETKTVKILPTTKKTNIEYTFRLVEYPEHIFTGHRTIETKNLAKNKEFIEDFFKTINFKEKPFWILNQETVFDVLDNNIKKDIVTKMKTFLDKYEHFEIET